MRKNPVCRDSNSRPNVSEGYEVSYRGNRLELYYPFSADFTNIILSVTRSIINSHSNLCLLIGPWWPAKAAPVTGTILRTSGPVSADFRQYVCMYGRTDSKSMDQPGEVANPAPGQLNRENEYFPVPVRAWEFGLARRFRESRPASACSSP